MYITIKEGQEVGRFFKLREGNTIVGRNPSCQVALPDDVSVSREHLRFTCKSDGTCSVTDLKSTNGSFLDGRRMLPDVPVYIQPGTLIKAGETVFEVVLELNVNRGPRLPRPVPAENFDLETMERRSQDTDKAKAERAARLATANLNEPNDGQKK